MTDDKPNSPADLGWRPEHNQAKGGPHANALKTPADTGDRGGTRTRRPSTGTNNYSGRRTQADAPPALPDACDWCGWLAPTLVLITVKWKKTVNIRNEKGRVVSFREIPKTETFWLCRLCSDRIPRRRPDDGATT